jgi:acetylornithine deacetylase
MERIATEIQQAVAVQELIDLASALIRIPSVNPPGNEQAIAEFLMDYCRALGLTTTVSAVAPGRPNVVARLESGKPGPHLIFNGHTDVVPAGGGWSTDPFTPVVRNGRLYGRGSADMKGGVAAMILAVEVVRRLKVPLRGTITLAMVADEEEGGSGTRQLVRDGLRGDWAIIPEPTELKPVIAHKGDFYFDLTLRGVAAHASVPHQGINAIYKAGKLLEAIQQLSERLRERRHPLVGHATATVGTIHGGEITCMVPAECRLSIDRRVLPTERTEDVVAEMQALLDELKRQDPEFIVELRTPVMALPMETDPNVAVVGALRAATAQILGADPGVHGWSATCDANMLVHDAKIPTVVFGPGSIAQAAHKPDESIAVGELVNATQIYALTIVQLLGNGSAQRA